MLLARSETTTQWISGKQRPFGPSALAAGVSWDAPRNCSNRRYVPRCLGESTRQASAQVACRAPHPPTAMRKKNRGWTGMDADCWSLVLHPARTIATLVFAANSTSLIRVDPRPSAVQNLFVAARSRTLVVARVGDPTNHRSLTVAAQVEIRRASPGQSRARKQAVSVSGDVARNWRHWSSYPPNLRYVPRFQFVTDTQERPPPSSAAAEFGWVDHAAGRAAADTARRNLRAIVG